MDCLMGALKREETNIYYRSWEGIKYFWSWLKRMLAEGDLYLRRVKNYGVGGNGMS